MTAEFPLVTLSECYYRDLICLPDAVVKYTAQYPFFLFFLNNSLKQPIRYGERRTIWQQTTLGHRFELIDETTGQNYGIYTVEHEGFTIIGEVASMVGTNTTNLELKIKQTLDLEWGRSQRVKRTFTELGFNVGRVPGIILERDILYIIC